MFWVSLQGHPAQADLLLDLPIKLFIYLFLYIHCLGLYCGKPNIPGQLCSYSPSIRRHSLDAPARHTPASRQQHLVPGIVWDDHHPNCPTHPAWDPCSTTSYYSLLAAVFYKQPGCSTYLSQFLSFSSDPHSAVTANTEMSRV